MLSDTIKPSDTPNPFKYVNYMYNRITRRRLHPENGIWIGFIYSVTRYFILAYHTDISAVLTVQEKSVFTRGYRQLARAV